MSVIKESEYERNCFSGLLLDYKIDDRQSLEGIVNSIDWDDISSIRKARSDFFRLAEDDIKNYHNMKLKEIPAENPAHKYHNLMLVHVGDKVKSIECASGFTTIKPSIIVELLQSYKGYEDTLRKISLSMLNEQDSEPITFIAATELALIYSLFLSGTLHEGRNGRDEKCKSSLAPLDVNFNLVSHNSSMSDVLWHIRNSVAHGRIIFGTYGLKICDEDKGTVTFDAFIGYKEFTEGFLKSLPSILSLLKSDVRMVYADVACAILDALVGITRYGSSSLMASILFLSISQRYNDNVRNVLKGQGEAVFDGLFEVNGITSKMIRNSFAHDAKLFENGMSLKIKNDHLSMDLAEWVFWSDMTMQVGQLFLLARCFDYIESKVSPVI